MICVERERSWRAHDLTAPCVTAAPHRRPIARSTAPRQTHELYSQNGPLDATRHPALREFLRWRMVNDSLGLRRPSSAVRGNCRYGTRVRLRLAQFRGGPPVRGRKIDVVWT